MLFNSWEFLIFLPVVLVVYYALARRAQNVWLALGSYFFYGWWDWRFTSLLLISTLLSFSCALLMERHPQRARAFLLLSVGGDLAILGAFKYFNFFIDSLISLFSILQFTPDVPTLRVLLPVGISFYTFQTISYTVDVYRGTMKPTRNFTEFALFVSFFPHLVAGPIVRPTKLLPQFERTRIVNEHMIASGLLLILLGYFKKVGIADAVAPHVDWAFADPEAYSSLRLLTSLYLFSIQIYCDFSGYSDIARGVARLLGIELMENFRQPYLSTNVTEFWRRWHISLSTWLRDYLYIPLGGNAGGTRKTYRNLILTMFLGGLWHGASWTFVVWGVLHGAFLAIHKAMLGERKRVTDHQFQSRGDYLTFAVNAFLTFNLVTLTWIFFRSPSLSSALEYLTGILVWRGSLQDLGYLLPVLFYGALVLFLDLTQYRRSNDVEMLSWHWAWRGALYASLVLVILLGGSPSNAPFIYFQF